MNPNSSRPLDPQTAQEIAVRGFVFLAADEKLVSRFSALSGITPGDMRDAAGEPQFLVGVLDFFLSNESDLMAWTSADNLAPEDAMRARFALEPQDHSGFE